MLSQTMISDYSLPCVSLKSFTSSGVTIYVQSAFLIFQSCYAVHQLISFSFTVQTHRNTFLLLSASKTSFSSMTSLPHSSASPVFGLVNKFNHFETKNSNHTQLNLFNFILTNLNHSEFVFQTTKFNPYFT